MRSKFTEAKKNKKTNKKPTKQLTCLSAEMTLQTPGLHKSRKHHSSQRVTTQGFEDDSSPIWHQDFEQLITCIL